MFVEWKLEITDFSNIFDESNLKQYLDNLEYLVRLLHLFKYFKK